MKIKILIPIYNDWQSADKVINKIDNLVKEINHEFSIFIINDGSSENKPDGFGYSENLNSLKILNIKNNIGHARCIATGLKYIFQNEEFDYVIPMDGDGEDRPEEIKIFIDNLNYNPDTPIVGERVKRSEGIFFKFSYMIHKLITFVFTGKSIKFGNYTFLPKKTVEKLINEKATWSSFSGALSKLENNLATIPSERGERYFGPSKMNFLSLVKHSLSIIAVFKASVILRSIAFYAIYLILISNNLSVITCIPLALIVIFGILIVKISGRENIEEFNSCLNNIDNIDSVK
ncbi:MAG: glycosyltransferase [Rickettsiales bacterium TMED289]|nr:MAG: glycosyltransferase [Rickettsiales bacterium TMED289]|tara:strand:- start:1350 stop:2219 length:870 start_codon:yes stop_codon:yes gene_type:complete